MNLYRIFSSFIFTSIFLLAQPLHAHVGYVLPEEDITALKGSDVSFLLQILQEPVNYIIIGGTLLFLFVAYIILSRVTPVRRFEKHVENRAEGYSIFVSWIIRLALGIALVGAGVSGAFISPALGGEGGILFIQILTGFLLLAGLFLTPAAILAAALFIIALGETTYLFGNLDFFAMAVVFLMLANPRPGIDHLLNIPQITFLKRFKTYTPLIMRIGLGGAMAYLAIYEKLLNPHLSEQVVVNYNLTEVIPVSASMWVFSAGFVELFLALLVLIGFKTRFVSVLAFLMLSLSFFYFKEAVYSHVTLFSALAVLFITDSGKPSLENYLSHKKKLIHIWK